MTVLKTRRLRLSPSGNRASSQVMERLGMHYKGAELWYDMTTSVYEITRAQWFEHARATGPTA